jgi:hypothetical protein
MNKRLFPIGLVFAAAAALLFYFDPSFEGPDTHSEARLESPTSRPDPLEAGLPSDQQVLSDVGRESLPSTEAPTEAVDERRLPDDNGADENAAPLYDPTVPDADYQVLYDEMSASALQVEYDALNEEVQEIAAEAYRSYFDTGRYEVVGYSKELTSVMQDRNKLMAFQVVPLPGQEVPEIRRVELIEEEYPETYSLHRRAILALDTLMQKQRSHGKK